MMTDSRQLEGKAMTQTLWAEAAAETICGEWSVEEQADYYGAGLADAVVAGMMPIKNLRRLVRDLNELDRQAVEGADGDLDSLPTEDYFEATARRIGHHSARTALSFVKTERHCNSYAVCAAMGRRELKDGLSQVLLTD
jgi:hypothetical protein